MNKKQWKDQYSAARMLVMAWAKNGKPYAKVSAWESNRGVAAELASRVICTMHPSVKYALDGRNDNNIALWYQDYKGKLDSFTMKQRSKAFYRRDR